MIRTILPAVLPLVMLIHPLIASAQAQTPPQQRGAPAPAPPPSGPQTPAPQRGQQTSPPQTPAPQPAPRPAAPNPPMPMTLWQVIDSLTPLKPSSRVEDLVSKSGVRFQATPAVLDILKEFGAGPKLLSMIPAAPAASAAAPKVAGPLTVTCEPKDCTVV